MTSEKTRPALWNMLFLCWLIACISTLGSLFFSEVMEQTPCVLCWYQRIFMFPLLFVFTVGLFPFDPRCARYALPISITGWGFALYHCLLYLGVIPKSMQPCTQGISCADVKIELFSFITIPLLSLIAFTLIVALLLALRKGLRP